MHNKSILLLGLALFFASPAYAANGEAVDLMDWQLASSPFVRAQSIGGLAIATSAEIGHQTGARANVTWSCAKTGTTFAVGISNGELDYSAKTNTFPLQTKIDSGTVSTFDIAPDSPRRFIVTDHLDPRVLFSNDLSNINKFFRLYVGFPANGEDIVLRVSFQDSSVRQFMTSCFNSLQKPGMQKLADIMETKPEPKIDVASEVKEEVKQEPKPVVAVTPKPPQPKPVVIEAKRAPVIMPKPAPVEAQYKPVAQPVVPAVPQQQASLQPPAVEPATPSVEPVPVRTPNVETQPMPQKEEVSLAQLPPSDRHRLSLGDEIALRVEYTPEAKPIKIGTIYQDIPRTEDDKDVNRIGDVSLGGDGIYQNTTLTVLGERKGKKGDWYHIRVNCPNCAADPAAPPPEGWIAAGDLVSWMDDPLCIRGTRSCY